MSNNSKVKNKNPSKHHLKNYFIGNYFNNIHSLSRNYKLQKPKIYKTRNTSLTNHHNLSFSSQERNIFSTSKYSITNKHSLNNSLLKRIKKNIRNKKIIDYSPHYNTEFTNLKNYKNYKNSPETISTAITSKRINNKSNLKTIKLKVPFNFNKIKNKIFMKFNSLRGNSLHFQNKITLEEEGYIITEESIFNNSNCQNNKSKKNLKNISQNSNISFDNLDVSYTYSDDTETKRYKKNLLNEYNNNELAKGNNHINNIFYCGDYDKNNKINNIKSCKTSSNKKDKKEDFKEFCEEIQKKLFGE